MMSDDEVRRALKDLRAADEAAAPAFGAVLGRPRRTYALDFRGVVTMALAASVMLVCTATVARIALKPRLVVPEAVIALSTWRPATDALLSATSQAWYAAPLPSDFVFGITSVDTPTEPYP